MDNPRKRLCQRDKESESETDQLYFNGYASIEVHEEMLMDTVRTMTYREAILKNQELFKDKVIADIGAGTGILSIFCIHAGAKKVYAIEASNMVVQTQLVIKENGMDSKISVIKGKVEVRRQEAILLLDRVEAGHNVDKYNKESIWDKTQQLI
ncbi:uncharacterized protein LOC106869562 [Octopus bimaculoides]|nr:uncharacterized protein LOC106869562 [Octopus bimaculoides]|eukprot:XP_014770845.1 PREDICTED: probable protein arginine N-methyltransferase 6 [Octopus bimaculoides]